MLFVYMCCMWIYSKNFEVNNVSFVHCARLGDFNDTPSSRLTIDEFLKIDLEQEHDPPCFLEAKKRSKQQQIAYSNQTQRVRYSELLMVLLYCLPHE